MGSIPSWVIIVSMETEVELLQTGRPNGINLALRQRHRGLFLLHPAQRQRHIHDEAGGLGRAQRQTMGLAVEAFEASPDVGQADAGAR